MLLYMFEMFLIVSVCSVAAFSSKLVVGRNLFSKCIIVSTVHKARSFSLHPYMNNYNTVHMD